MQQLFLEKKENASYIPVFPIGIYTYIFSWRIVALKSLSFPASVHHHDGLFSQFKPTNTDIGDGCFQVGHCWWKAHAQADSVNQLVCVFMRVCMLSSGTWWASVAETQLDNGSRQDIPWSWDPQGSPGAQGEGATLPSLGRWDSPGPPQSISSKQRQPLPGLGHSGTD